MRFERRLIATVFVLMYLITLGGCYSYSYHHRGPGPTFNKVAIDYNDPASEIHWSYIWGGIQREWTPLQCTNKTEEESCKNYTQVCEGRGVGRVEFTFSWYSTLAMLVTLGIAVPTQVTIYCATDQAPYPSSVGQNLPNPNFPNSIGAPIGTKL